MKLKVLVLPLVLILPASQLQAQDSPPGELIDRIVAVVGDSMILNSDVEDALFRLAAMGQQVPSDSAGLAELKRELLELQIDELLLVQAAIRDSILLPDEAVEAEVQNQLAQQRQAYGERGFEEALRTENLTLADYREILSREIRRSYMIQTYLEYEMSRRPAPLITEEELSAAFEAERERLGQRPATISFEQVVVAPSPSDSAKALARAQAEEVLALARAGEDFAQLARRYSQDPGSREQGGDLGWFRRGIWVAPFDSAVFAMRPGTLSGVVETEFGFHIIRLERVRGAERQARHILIRPELGDEDHARSRQEIERVLDRVRAGESMQALAEQVGDPRWDPLMESIPRARLAEVSEAHARALAGAEVGELVGPVRLQAGGTDLWLALRITETSEPREYTLDDVRSSVRDAIAERKLLDEILVELRANTYIARR